MYSAVIFDLDGTLLNTLADLANAGNHTLEVLGFPTHPVDAYRYLVGNGIPKLIERMLPEKNRGPATQQTALSIMRPTNRTPPPPTPAFCPCCRR